MISTPDSTFLSILVIDFIFTRKVAVVETVNVNPKANMIGTVFPRRYRELVNMHTVQFTSSIDQGNTDSTKAHQHRHINFIIAM